MQFDDGLPVAQTSMGNIPFHHERRYRERTGKARCTGQRQLEFECDQHSRPGLISAWAPACADARSCSSVARDIRGGLYLSHQVVVPLAFDLEVGGGAELDGLDQIVGDV